MKLKAWTEVVVPRGDVRGDGLDQGVFAADLADVVANRGPIEYRDPRLFFQGTYFTNGLRSLASTVLKRLSGRGGEAVLQIQTPFGGGKTHGLIALYHLVKNGKAAEELLSTVLEEAGISSLPDAEVVTFVGTAADAVGGRTPWGELAAQLGNYALLETHDQKRLSPGKELIHQLLQNRPVLILMDELSEYAVKAREFRSQLMAFFHELTEAVKVTPSSILVVTLPSSVPYAEEGEMALLELQKIFGRVENVKIPIQGEEVYEVIRRRLFESIGSEEERANVVKAFFRMYQNHKNELLPDVQEKAYQDRMLKAYPFHPEVIDVLFERWSTFPDFQRTRGVLRLLALVVGDLYRAKHQAPLILPAHINLGKAEIRAEFIRHIGQEYQAVIQSDINQGGHAKAEKIEKRLGSECARYELASGIARTIFFTSFSGSGKRPGVGIQRLRLGVLTPEVKLPLIGDVLKKLEDELWYLHVDREFYYLFQAKPNLNRIIAEREEGVSSDAVEEEIRKCLEEESKGKGKEKEFGVILWPTDPQDVTDGPEPKLVLLSLEHTWREKGLSTNSERFANSILEKSGSAFRIRKNAVLLLVAEENTIARVQGAVKRYLAYRSIEEDKGLNLSEEQRKAVSRKLSDTKNEITHQLAAAYARLGKFKGGVIEWMKLEPMSTSTSIVDRVRNYLEKRDLMVRKLSPSYLLEKAIGEQEKTVGSIYEIFASYTELPILKSKDVLLDAIAEGVQKGVFGVRLGERILFKEVVNPKDLDDEAVVIQKAALPQKQEAVQPEEAAKEVSSRSDSNLVDAQLMDRGGEVSQESKASSQGEVQRGRLKKYELSAVIPAGMLSHFAKGVLMPLQMAEATIELEIHLRASSEVGIPLYVIKNQVEETIRQIGGKIHYSGTPQGEGQS
ncbi:MAG: DUF499 domain-containing protein [Sandaracinaceae bacterium]|nr:DUF499 domain-containing protein [Sandaracinaceae bacterium]